MALSVHILPCLKDNYIYLLADGAGAALAVDPGDAAPVIDYCDKNNLRLQAVFCTHYHGDHTGGVTALAARYAGLEVYGAADSDETIPALTHPVAGGDVVLWGDTAFIVMNMPGHTAQHVIFFAPDMEAAFVGDVLFPLGCGRVLTGDMDAMFASLEALKELPDSTRLYAGHEYMMANAGFAAPYQNDRAAFDAYVQAARVRIEKAGSAYPVLLGDEMRFNPFLTAGDIGEFTKRRQARNHFVA